MLSITCILCIYSCLQYDGFEWNLGTRVITYSSFYFFYITFYNLLAFSRLFLNFRKGKNPRLHHHLIKDHVHKNVKMRLWRFHLCGSMQASRIYHSSLQNQMATSRRFLFQAALQKLFLLQIYPPESGDAFLPRISVL